MVTAILFKGPISQSSPVPSYIRQTKAIVVNTNQPTHPGQQSDPKGPGPPHTDYSAPLEKSVSGQSNVYSQQLMHFCISKHMPHQREAISDNFHYNKKLQNI